MKKYKVLININQNKKELLPSPFFLFGSSKRTIKQFGSSVVDIYNFFINLGDNSSTLFISPFSLTYIVLKPSDLGTSISNLLS